MTAKKVEDRRSPEAVIEALVRHNGNISAVAREFGTSAARIREQARRSGAYDTIHGATGRIRGIDAEKRPLPKKGKVKRYLITSAQNNTEVHEAWWENLLALAAHFEAELMVGTFSYDINRYGPKSVKRGKDKPKEERLWYDEAIKPYISDGRVLLAPGLQWCGEMNILPTAVNPLSDLDSYTGRASGIFPHAKIAMRSVVSGKYEGTKLNYTTGTVSKRNYIAKKAGLKAEFHHAYGALIVEVDSDGRWFVRQINAQENGDAYDLDVFVSGGEVTTGHTVEGITWGDIHHAKIDPTVQELAWGEGGMLDTLKPRYQFFHDLVDFHSRGHHERGNHHAMFERFVEGKDSVQSEMQQAASFLTAAKRDGCDLIVVDSNHDNALEKWLRDDPAAYARDPLNAVYFLHLQQRKYEALAALDRWFHMIEFALYEAGCPADTRFLREDESFIICPDAHDGIECGMHGHLGPNGSKGTPQALRRMGRKANTGHTHSAAIIDGMYVAGLSGLLDQRYNKGPGSWSQSHILTYPNGKRAIVTMWKGKWRA